MEKVYLVISSCGIYEDYRTNVEGVFKKKEDAVKFAKYEFWSECQVKEMELK